MKIKSIYHSPVTSFALCKQLGFTHVNLPMWTYAKSLDLQNAISSAHKIGLHCIVSDRILDDHKPTDRSEIVRLENESKNRMVSFLPFFHCNEAKCLVSLWDEANTRKIHPEFVKKFKSDINVRGYKTICVLGWTESYRGYENCADYIGFNYYKDLTLSRKLILWARIKAFQIRNRSPIVAVPAVKPGKIFDQFDFWQKWIKPDGGFYWFQFFPQQESPPWHDKDVSQDADLQIAFKKINTEGK